MDDLTPEQAQQAREEIRMFRWFVAAHFGAFIIVILAGIYKGLKDVGKAGDPIAWLACIGFVALFFGIPLFFVWREDRRNSRRPPEEMTKWDYY